MFFNSMVVVLLLQTVNIASAVFEGCDNLYSINNQNNYVVQSPHYPAKYDSGTSCRYTFKAPEGYGIKLYGSIDFYKPDPSKCSSERFYVSEDADPNMQNAAEYCGKGTIEKHSVFNKISFAFVSTSQPGSGIGGIFNITLSVEVQACDCGWSQSSKIVGGTNVGQTEFPGMAALIETDSSTSFCGASIISAKCLITAAHCTRLYPNVNKIIILVGYISLFSSTDNRYGKTYGVSKILEHPSYDPNTYANDIALLYPSSEIDFSRGVGPFCLPMDSTFNYDYLPVSLVGFGTTDFGGMRSQNLQKTSVNIIPNQQCLRYYPNIQSSQLCTYTYKHDACQYDSGGPVIYTQDRHFLCGAISYGNGCGVNPAVQTKIYNYISWIKKYAPGIICYKPIR